MKIKSTFLFTIAVLFCYTYGFTQQFYNSLRIPPALNGNKFTLVETAGLHQFYPGINTSTWGYNGNFLGPTLFLNKGDSVSINVVNNLSDTTTAHWHGLHVPPMYDGGPHSPIPPGKTWSAYFRVRNQASTYWYHPHGNMKTTEHIARGLAGLIIVKDTIESKLNLPRTYGTDDIPVILQDRRYDSTGNFVPLVALGDSMLVNGTANPYANLPAQVVRIRNLNASTGRFYNLGFSDNRIFYVIASDGGLLEKPYQTNRLLIGVGERYEILLDLTAAKPGDSVFLMSYASEMGWRVPGGGDLTGEESPLNAVDFKIMKINVVNKTGMAVTAIPSSLVKPAPIDPASVNRTKTKHITGHGMVGHGAFLINNVAFDMHAINDTVYQGKVEKWIFTNTSNLVHPIHIHGVSFYIVDINGNPPAPHMAGLKDVFLIYPNMLPDESVTLLMKFEDFTDHMVPYMYHCHLLRHEDMGMMHSFLVLNDPSGIDDMGHHSKENLVYPNPTKGKFTIKEKGHCTIYNLMGEIIFEEKVDASAGKQVFDLSNQAGGIYLLRFITSDNSSRTQKIIITK